MGTPVKPGKLSLPGNGVSELLTAPELAALFKLNSQTLYRLAQRGVIPAIRIGEKSLRFDPIQVREALLEGRRASRPRVRPRRSSARPTAFTRLEDLRAQNRWIAPSPGLALERFAVDFPPGIDLTTLAYTALDNEVPTLYTLNDRHFRRFGLPLQVVNPASRARR